MTSPIKEDLANMDNVFDLAKAIPPHFARAPCILLRISIHGL